MAVTSWTRKENEYFKKALPFHSVFLPTRFECMAKGLKKSVVDVMEHYQAMVDDLLEIGSSQVALPEELIGTNQVERTIWNKEEHEWFLIGLKRFGKDWDKIAVLLDSKSPMQVEIYAHNYFNWENMAINVMKTGRAKDLTLVDTNMDPAGQQENLFHLRSEPQQGKFVLAIGLDA